MEGLVLELGLEGLALADVADVEHDPRDRSSPSRFVAQCLDVAPAVLGVAHAELGGGGRSGRLRGDRRDEATHALGVVGVGQLRQLTAHQAIGGMAEHALHRRAHEVHNRVAADDADDVGGVRISELSRACERSAASRSAASSLPRMIAAMRISTSENISVEAPIRT